MNLKNYQTAHFRAQRPFTDEHDFSRHVSPQIPSMLRAAREILGSEDLAWDAVQETLLRLWCCGWPSERPAAALRRLATLSAQHLARCGRRRRLHEDQACGQEPCCSEDPLAEVAGAELRATLRTALARVTGCYRLVFELYEFEGRDYQEIAAVLSVPIGTVRSRLSRARRELREHLQVPEGLDAPSSG